MDHPQLERAFRDALTVWSAAGEAKWEAPHLFRVDPQNGYPQKGTHLTAFATALFGEVVALLKEQCCNARVAYRGVDRADQPKLHGLFRTRHPDARLVVREALTLDFAIVHRAEEHHPHSVHIAFESEMEPVSAPGTDPDLVVPDFAKLCLLPTGPKFFLCRFNGGRETIARKKVLKSERIIAVLQRTLEFAASLPTLAPNTPAAVFAVETAPRLPGVVHTLTLNQPVDGHRSVTIASFEVAAEAG